VLAQEISQKAPCEKVASTSDDESTDSKRAEPTSIDQIRTALECMVEMGKYSQDSLFAALVCDVCGICDNVRLFEKVGIQEGIFIYLIFII
jgi:hypothetical protein